MKTVINLEFLLSKCRNMLGFPLDTKDKEKITECVNNPTEETWNEVCRIFIERETTLWQAVVKVKPDFPEYKNLEGFWPEIPDRETLIKAISNTIS